MNARTHERTNARTHERANALTLFTASGGAQANMMAAMGLPCGFTSGFQVQAEAEAEAEAEEERRGAEEEAHGARVREAWERYNPYGR